MVQIVSLSLNKEVEMFKFQTELLRGVINFIDSQTYLNQ
mgnify:CR=1 FL=1